MTDSWDTIRTAFNRARELQGAARQAYIDTLRAEDPELADTVERMLETPASFLDDENDLDERTPVDVPPPQFSRYVCEREIGRGAMGIVYRAHDIRLEDVVAVKVLHPSLALTAGEVESFAREARLTTALRHEGVVLVRDADSELGLHYFVMDLVDGPDLATVLDAFRSGSPPPTRGLALESFTSRSYCISAASVMARVADALQAAHSAEIVHRDVKPNNVLLGTDGSVKIVDFGIAFRLTQARLDRAMDLAGALGYMSPEQLTRQRSEIDRRSDVYSLGVTLYEMLTLKRPFQGNTSRDIINRILHPNPPRVRTLNARVPRDMEAIVETAMDPNPARRYQSAHLLAEDLRRFMHGEAVLARRQSVGYRAYKLIRRHRIAAGGVVLALFVAAAAFWIGAWSLRDEQRRDMIEEAIVLTEMLASQEHENVSTAMAAQAVALIQQYRAEHVGDPTGALQALEQSLAAYKDLLEADLVSMDAYLRRAEGLTPGQILQIQLRMLRTQFDLATVFHESYDSAPESVYPSLSVAARDGRGRDVDATVHLYEMDLISTLPRRDSVILGPAPIVDHRVVPGFYRVVIVFANGDIREFPIHTGPTSMSSEITAIQHTDLPTITHGMIRIEGGTHSWALLNAARAPETPLEHLPVHAHFPVEIAPFYLDAHEVSNADFRQYLDATRPPAIDGVSPPHPHMPLHWERKDFAPPPDDLPVVGVTWTAASAYAAWAGKRLPTLAEMRYAATGVSNSEPVAMERPNIGHHLPNDLSRKQEWDYYRDNVDPVKANEDCGTPGLMNLTGNVREWTSTFTVDPIDETYQTSPTTVYVAGSSWDSSKTDLVPAIMQYGISDRHRSIRIGFRCARSEAPR